MDKKVEYHTGVPYPILSEDVLVAGFGLGAGAIQNNIYGISGEGS